MASSLLFGSNQSQQYTSENQRLVFDPSNNIVMFETYIRPPPRG